jgi:hypothetical protein
LISSLLVFRSKLCMCFPSQTMLATCIVHFILFEMIILFILIILITPDEDCNLRRSSFSSFLQPPVASLLRD